MKVIIDIPEIMIQDLKDGCFGVRHNVYELAGCIMNGTPLDDVKKEIFKLIDNTDSIYGTSALHSVLDILDNIGKAESE